MLALCKPPSFITDWKEPKAELLTWLLCEA